MSAWDRRNWHSCCIECMEISCFISVVSYNGNLFFFISSVSCFHVFPCVHFHYTLPAPARACVLRDLTNEHKVTKFEQEEEDDDEVGCQDEMPRILFPLPAPVRACVLRDLASSSCARALVCCVISRTSIMSRNAKNFISTSCARARLCVA